MLSTRIITCGLAAVGVFFIGSQASLRFGGSEATAQQGGPAVTVVNTPLPVTVTNPTVPPSTVSLGNTAALAAAIAQASRGTPVSFTLEPFNNPYSVPIGQRLILEYVSGHCSPEGGFSYQNPRLAVTTNGVQQIHEFAFPAIFSPPGNLAPLGSPSLNAVSFGNSVKIYADGGSNVFMVPLSCTLIVSGQLVTP